MNFEEIASKSKDAETIEELFALWKEAHRNEDRVSCGKTIPCGEGKDKETKQKTGEILYIPQDSFVEDGYISENGEKDFQGTLFILKEANILNQCDVGKLDPYACDPYRGDQYGFYREYIKGKEKDNPPKQKEKMGRMADYLAKNRVEQNSDFKDPLYHSAFMNLNKRGGAEGCDLKKLRAYCEKYQDFIKKQIQLLQPEKVICLGTYRVLEVTGIITAENKNLFVDMWHPAYRMKKKPRNHRYGLNDLNVDCYMEHFVQLLTQKTDS